MLLLVLTLSVGALVAGVIEANQQRDQHNTLIVLAANLASRVEDFRYFETVARPGARPLDVAIADATWFSEEFSRTLEQLAATDADGEWPPLLRQSFDDYTSVVHQYFVIYAIASDETTRWVESELSPRRLNLQNITADTLTYYQQADASNTFAREPVAVTVLVVSALLLLAVLIARWSVRRAEQRVAARNERPFQALVQQSSDVVVILDRNGRFDYVSPAVSGLVDYVPEELAGTDSLAFIHPEDLPRVKDALQVAVATPGVKRAETFRFKAAHGEWKWIEAIPTNLLTDPLIHGLVLNCRDVTEKIATAEEARRRDARFRSLVQHSSDVISIYDEDWLLRYASPAMERLLGLDAKELEGTHAGHLVHPDDHFRLRLNFERLKRMPDRARTFSFRAQHHHGGWRHVETIAKNRFDDPSIKGIVANARDVTDRLEAAAERRKIEERYRTLVEQASDVTVIVDPGGIVTWVSPAVERALGITPDRLIGAALSPLLADEDAGRLDQLLRDEVAEAGATASATLEFPRRGDAARFFDVVATNYLADPAVQGIVLNCRDVTEREDLLALLWNQANHDALTNLPTRDYFLNQLETHLEGTDREFAVCILDVDGFKRVNDSLGHAAGDEVLVHVVERLRRVARGGELLARFGGDEFTLLVEDVSDETAAHAVAERMVDAVSTPFSLNDGRRVSLGISAGVALSRPQDDAAALLRHADMAMYTAKSLGKGRVAVFDAAMASREGERLELAASLQGALDDGGLHLVYQPVIELRSGRIVACEALARWDDPLRGEIAPAEFIRLAEAFSSVEQLDGWVLKTACSEAVRWQLDGVAPVGVHVNVSPVQFTRPAFAALVATVLQETGLSPELLTLDVTESMAMEEPDRAGATLVELHALGVRLAIDDFGTGFTKLALLQRLPLDALKIDRTFIHRIGIDDGTAVIEAILSIARSLEFTVIAEGIETPRQLNALLSLHCAYGQGRLFDHPLRDHDIRQRLIEQSQPGWPAATQPPEGTGTDILTNLIPALAPPGEDISQEA
ncbi:MAG: sensor domain-containing protein [Thermomicrobiales bacterium]